MIKKEMDCGRRDNLYVVSTNDINIMRTKHRKTLGQVCENPVRPDIFWSDIESLLSALGAEITEGRGSRVRVFLNGVRAVFHRPQPPSHKATAGQVHKKKQIEVR
jgi:hypothetical protein